MGREYNNTYIILPLSIFLPGSFSLMHNKNPYFIYIIYFYILQYIVYI